MSEPNTKNTTYLRSQLKPLRSPHKVICAS